MTGATPSVLFVCVHNAGRSQMAAALLASRAPHVVVYSAGSAPASEINDVVREAMTEVGIDLADASPRKLSDSMVESADVVVTMGCDDACPVFPGKRYLDWELDDPAGKPLEDVRRIRDEIALRVDRLIFELARR